MMSVLKNQVIVIDEEDDDNDFHPIGESRRLNVKPISDHNSTVSDGIHVPIICLDDDDDDDEYVKFLDNVRDDGRLGPEFESNRFKLRYEGDNGVFDIRRFGKSSKTLLARIQRDDRVIERRKRKREISRAPLVKIQEDIQRDNRAVERRRRRLAGTIAAETSRSVSLGRTQEDKQRSNSVGEQRKRKFSETKAAGDSRDVPLVTTQEDILRDERDGEQRKMEFSETMTAEASRDVPLVTTQEDIQRENRAGEQRKREFSETMAAEASRDALLVTTQEDIERDNSIGEQRKREFSQAQIAEALRAVSLDRTQEDIERDNSTGEQGEMVSSEIKAAGDSEAVPLASNQEDIERDKCNSEQGKMVFSETMAAEASRVSLVTTQEDIERDNGIGEQRKREFSQAKIAEAFRAVSLARTQEDIERYNSTGEQIEMVSSEIKAAGASEAVPLATTQEDIESDNSSSEQVKMVFSETNAAGDTEDPPLFTTQEDIQRDNSIRKWEKRKLSRTKARGAARVVPLSRVSKDEWLNCRKNVEVKEVNETSRDIPVTQINKRVAAGRKRKTEEESLATIDEDYTSYLKWLLTNLKAAVSEKHPSGTNQDTPMESTIIPEMNLLPVKLELGTESWSDSEVVVLGDSPFMNGECTTPFVVSKSEKVIAIDESINSGDEDQSRHWFKEKLMDILERPYDEKELLQLSHEVSIHKQRTRCRELRDGREITYATDNLASSYLDLYPDFGREYIPLQSKDSHRALKLLRGFFFYLKNVAHEGAFKPWMTKTFN